MPQILDHRGLPFQTGQLTEPQTSKLAWLQHEFQRHPSRGLTPSRLARLLEDAEFGYILSQLELWEDMTEKDGHLFAEMSKRQRALLTVEWDILPPTNATSDEQKAAEAIEERLRAMDDLEDVFLGAAAAIGPAFSCQEIEWELLGRDWFPCKITTRPNTWFTLDRETRTEIRLRDQSSAGGVPLNAFGWIAHVHRAKPGYLARAGLVRQLCWPYLFKTYAVGDLAEFLEIYGLPIRVGKYPPASTKDEKAALLQAVISIGHDAAGIVPDGMTLDFQEASDGKPDSFLGMNDLMERTESKVILGATLTSQADGKTSTNALGQVHNDVRLDILASDARQIESTLKRDLIYPLGMLNGLIKDPRRVPRLRFDVQEEEDFKTMADGIKTTVDMGLRVGVKWAREQLRVPEPTEGEDVLERQAPPAVGALPNPGGPAKKVPDRVAANIAALAAALQQRESFPDQAALEAAIDALDPEELQAQAEQLLAPVIELIRREASAEAVLVALSHQYPEMNTERLQKLLANAYFVADLWGRIANQGDTE